MRAARFARRLGGFAAAFGVSVVFAQATATADPDTGTADPPSAEASAQSESAVGPRGGSTPASAVEPESSPVPARSRRIGTVPGLPDNPARGIADTVDALPSSASTRTDSVPVAHSAPVAVLAADSAPVAVPAAATLSASAATSANPAAGLAVLPAPSAEVATSASSRPSPMATTTTPYGVLGEWMRKPDGQVADWGGRPYCGKGSSAANCKADTPGAKTLQEPINTVFVVKARTRYEAELQLDWSLRASGFGPSCCSTIGYSGIVGSQDYKQLPRGGPLGLGLLPPLPFGLFQNGLLGLAGIGPAYRDLPFLLPNTHLRTFGGEPDGKGNFIFTAAVSKENLDPTGGLLSAHGYESFAQGRQTLVDRMVASAWLSSASNQGLVAMNNAISPDDPNYTTADHDGLAQVIVIGSLFGSAPVRPTLPSGAERNPKTARAAPGFGSDCSSTVQAARCLR